MTTARVSLLVLLSGLVPLAVARANDAVIARTWLVDDGLPNNAVNRLALDGRGFMWLGTGSGLARFDGRDFLELPLPMASPEGNFNIRDLVMEDERTVLMLPASGGVVRWRDGGFSAHPASAALKGKSLLDLFAEPDGTLWVGTGPGEMIRWRAGVTQIFGLKDGLVRRNNRFTFVRDAERRVWIGGGEFLGSYQDGRLVRFPGAVGAGIVIAPSRSGGLWISTTERLLRLEGDRLTVMCGTADWQPVERGGVQALGEDQSGALWIGTRRQGLYRLEGGAPRTIALPNNNVTALLADPESNVWVATAGGGLTRLRPKAFTLLNSDIGLTDDVSTAVCEDGDGAIWCANRAGGVVRWRDGDVQRPTHPGAVPPYAVTVCSDHDGVIWVGASDGLYRIPRGTMSLALVSHDQRDAHVIFCTRSGDLWVGYGSSGFAVLHEGKWRELTERDGYTRRRVKALAEDSHGTLWVATDDRQVFEVVNGKLVCRLTRDQMPGGLIYSLHFDAADGLWIPTSRGLVLKRGERLALFTTHQGLPDDQLSLVLAEGGGRLWFGSRRGFFCVPGADLLAVADGRALSVNAASLGREDGLSGVSALNGMQPQAWPAHDGRLWFATHGGVVGLDPAMTLPNRAPPKVFIDEASVNRAPIALGRALRLGAGAGELEFKFSAVSFSAADKVRVRHQLVGYDFGWVETSVERRASYVRLPPGNYTLRVGASFAGSAWGPDSVVLPVHVTPAWWQTLWFRAGAVLGLAALAGWLARIWSHRRLTQRLARLEREHALEKERARIARDLHDELGGSLTQIGLLADRIKRQSTTTEMQQPLGQLVARTRRLAGELESIVWTVNPKNNTWDRLAIFIEQFARDFCREAGLECEVHGADDVPKLPVAPEVQNDVLAVVKEALNNVAKHARATHVTLHLAGRPPVLELRVADNGIGFNTEAPEHMERNGLNNMRARIADIGGQVEIRSTAGRGTEVVVQQPFESKLPQPHA